MKGLRKYLTPFAPDQSGAVSVLYELGGILIILDAGGCVGNICGFDEPRWQGKKSAVFSAGLRDMDAIMGRDELLVKKLVMAAREIDAKFVALIGTPVPSVIGTDYHALTRMAERKLNLPIIPVDTNGMELSDKGAAKAYLELMRKFAGQEKTEKAIGILGCSPLEVSDLEASIKLQDYYGRQGYKKVFTYGMDRGLEDLAYAGSAEKNIVVSPSGLMAAKYLEKTYGTPYQCFDPLASEFIKQLDIPRGQRVLIVDQQIAANSMREALTDAEQVTCASWFSMEKNLKQDGDLHLKEEDDFQELADSDSYDVIIGDPVLKKMARGFTGRFIERKQFALSGKLN